MGFYKEDKRYIMKLNIPKNTETLIIEDFLPRRDLLKLQYAVLGEDEERPGRLPLYYQLDTLVPGYDPSPSILSKLYAIEAIKDLKPRVGKRPFFAHVYCNQGAVFPENEELFKHILSLINYKNLLRVKVNVSTSTDTPQVTGWHQDLELCDEGDKYTIILYINSTGGGTLLETGEFFENVENRLVAFRSDIHHTGVTHTDPNVGRALININIEV